MISVNRLLIFLWTFLLLCFRPSIIAQTYNAVIFIFFLIVTVLIFIFSKEKFSFKLSQKEVILLFFIFVTISYFLIQGLILSDAKPTVIRSCFFLFGVIPAIFLVIRIFAFKTLIVKYLINVHFYLSLSQIITFLIFTLSSFELNDELVLINLQSLVKYNVSEQFSLAHYLVFPFTVIWSVFQVGDIEFYRSCGIYREPGMAQIFYLTALFLSFYYKEKNSSVKQVTIIIGSILLFSASGFLNLILGLFTYFIFNKLSKKISVKSAIQMVIGLVLLVIFSAFTLYSISRKMQVESGYERSENIKKSFKGISENPVFGEGYYKSYKIAENGLLKSEAFLSFVGVINQLGSFGSVLYLLCWFVGLYFFSNKSSYFIYVPCFVTLLTSQPSYNDVFVWFLLLFDTSQFYLPQNNNT